MLDKQNKEINPSFPSTNPLPQGGLGAQSWRVVASLWLPDDGRGLLEPSRALLEAVPFFDRFWHRFSIDFGRFWDPSWGGKPI